MFCFVAAGWFVLFLVNLVGFEQDVGWWIRGAVSGLFTIGSAVIALTLWRRRDAARGSGSS